MAVLTGEDAFRALRSALSAEVSAGSFSCQEVPYERLRLALIDPTLSPVDRVVRMRHALRYASLSALEQNTTRSLPLPDGIDWLTAAECAAFGLRGRPGRVVEAMPWTPDWLSDVPSEGVDANAVVAALRPWNNSNVAVDPWLQDTLGFSSFRGPGQALAVRCALHVPPGQTLLVLLPTGEGKSLVFQALAAAHPDKTVAVVVPTRALAIDHAASIRQFPVLHPEHAHAYVGADEQNKAAIREAISSGKQGLVYAAPEAMVTSLRQPLIDAARNGCLAGIVIDEAHLVDAWGTDFRSEFQLLAALVAEVRGVAPPDKQPVVVCLSATVTQEAKEALESLFSPQEPISLVPATRLRPEPDIWLSAVCPSKSERNRRVIEALRYLPRPAILYVTQPEDAESWLRTLRSIGFGRVGAVHGHTSDEDRVTVVESWRRGDLDLVVGTSAFGLGIDFAHVRTVIHACIPESLDRYYQEIGRSGRDNCASIALLIPAADDFAMAESLSTKRIITVEKGVQRWRAMFKKAVRSNVDTNCYSVDLRVSPGYDPDMKSERNEDWNGRVLALMARSGLIRFTGLQFDNQTQQTNVTVEVLEDGHSELALWTGKVEQVRQRLLSTYRAAYQSMCDVLRNQCCPSIHLSKLYRISHRGGDFQVVPACGGCVSCRSSRPSGWFALWPSAPAAPWSIGSLTEHLKAHLEMGRCIIEREHDVWASKRDQRRLREMVNGLWDAGIRKCIVVGEAPKTLTTALGERPWCVAIGKNEKVLASNGLPPGPEMVWVSPAHALKNHHLGTIPNGLERIILLPSNPVDPLNPSRLLADRFPLVSFDKFYDYLLP